MAASSERLITQYGAIPPRPASAAGGRGAPRLALRPLWEGAGDALSPNCQGWLALDERGGGEEEEWGEMEIGRGWNGGWKAGELHLWLLGRC